MIDVENIVESVILSRALYVSCNLNIAEKLDANNFNIADLSKLLECNIDALSRLMRYLISNGVFKINDKGEVSTY